MNKVREYRKSKGLTQAKLAEAAGIKRTAITALEIGQYELTVKNAKLIANALGIDWWHLFD